MISSTPANTYDDDFYAWTQEQAAALRVLSADGLGRAIDFAHVAEEIEDLGRRDLRQVTSYLAILLEHVVKIDCNEKRGTFRTGAEKLSTCKPQRCRSFHRGCAGSIETPALWRLAGKW